VLIVPYDFVGGQSLMNNSLNKKINYKNLIGFAIPTIISNVFMSIYMTIDGIFVSNFVGTDALSAVNIVMPFLMVSIALGTMLATGGSALVSKIIGENNINEARRSFSLITLVSLIMGVILVLVSMLFKEQILRMLGADETIYTLVETYAETIFYIVPFAILGILFQIFFITEGKPLLGMSLSVIGGVMNIVFDYILIAKLNMGLQGAALATGIGCFFSFIVGSIYFAVARKGTLYFVKPKFVWNTVNKSISNGASEMVTMLSSSIIVVLMNNIMIRLAGVDGVSAITIILYAQSLLSSVYVGYSVGIAPIISFNYGKNDGEKIKKINTISLKFLTYTSLISFLSSLLLADPIIKVFTASGTPVYSMALEGFLVFSGAFLFMGYNIYASALFTALNNGKVSALLSLFRTFILQVLTLIIFPAVFDVKGVWIATPVTELLSLIMSIYFIKSVYQHSFQNNT
jgi:putative MATE family efflux protein